MAAPTYVAQGSAVTSSTAAAPAYPAGIAAGDLLVMYLSSDSSSIPTTQSGWTGLGSVTTAGGVSAYAWAKTAAGTETGTFTISGITGGTKGLAWIAAYRPATGGNTLTATATYGTDTDSTSTAYSATGSSWTTAVDNVVVAMTTVLTTGAFTANATIGGLTQAGATLTRTDRFAGRAATNTLYYGHGDAAVTAGGTGAPTLAATTVGANGAGVTAFVRLVETSAPVTSAVFDTVVSLGAWSKYGSAATTEAGIGDADDTTGVISSTAGNDPLILGCSASLASGSRDVTISLTAPSGTGSISTEIRASDGTTVLSAAKTKTAIGATVVTEVHTVTLASATAGMRLYAWANPS